MAVMKQTVAELKSATTSINIDELEDMHEDITDMLADVEDINEMMSRPYDTYNGVTDADLDDALAALDDELAGPVAAPAAAAPAAAAPAAVPARAVPTAVPAGGSSYAYPSVPTALPSVSVPTHTGPAGTATTAIRL